ncbi:MAG: hypothetical protein U0793_08055 [Gemmataceae bacterium]
MHPAFQCFEWGVCDVPRPHPLGYPVRPDGLWSHAAMSLRRTGEDIGDAWYLVEGDTLTVLVQVGDKNGSRDDPWLIRLVADTLFGEEGLLDGYYEHTAPRVRYRNLKTGGVWEGSWAQMRAEPGSIVEEQP